MAMRSTIAPRYGSQASTPVPTFRQAAGALVGQAVGSRIAQAISPSVPQFTPGAEITIVPQSEAHISDLPLSGRSGFPEGWEVNPSGYLVKKRRRRRRRLLSAQDRADIAFIVGILGKGQLAQAAISTLLTRGR